MAKRIKVFMSGPYSSDPEGHFQNQNNVLDILLDLGFAPYAPLLFHRANPRPYQDLLDLVIEWMESCDCILRLPGDSPGADAEIARANQLGIPVVYSIEELIKLYPVKTK